MKATFAAGLAVLIVAVQPAWSQSDSISSVDRRRAGGPARRVVRAYHSPVQAFLAQRVESVDWDDVPLESVVEWLEDQGKDINVIVAWRALEVEGVDVDTPVTLRMHNATVGQVLTEVVDQLSESEDGVRFRGVGRTLKISTRRDFNRKLYVRVYDAADLVLTVPDFKGPTISVSDQGGGGGGGGGGGFGGGGGGGFGGGGGGGFGGGGGGFGGGGLGGGGGSQQVFTDSGDEEEDDEDVPLEERMDDLVELIRNTIDPEGWQENGGRNTIRAWKTFIIVRAPIEVHEVLGGPFVLPE